MASLNTLRTKFGILLSVVIAGALLAFILSLKTEMGFSGNDPKVGEIDGEKVLYSEFLAAYDDVKAQMGGEAYDEQQAAQLLSATWQNLLADHVLTPGLEDMGLGVASAEHTAMLKGEQASNVYATVFADPKTGAYSIESVTEFLKQVESNPQAAKMWSLIQKQAKLDRALTKYVALVRNSAYANKLQVERGVNAENNSYKGRYAMLRYHTVADSLVNVSDKEVKAYYKANKEQYKQTPYRTISYVVLDVEATEADKAAVEATAKAATAEFAAASDVKAFSRENRHASVAQAFVTLDAYGKDEAKALAAGRTYGPELVGDEWHATRVVETRTAPEKLTLRHIVLPYTEDAKAEELLAQLRKGASFEALAKEHSIAETAADGGNIGEVEYASLSPEFADAFKGVKKGQVVKVVFGNAIQLMKAEKLSASKKHYRIATLTYKVEPSQETQRTVHNTASTLAVAAKGSVEKFNEAVAAQGLSSRSMNIEQSERNVRGIDGNSIEVVRWANDAEVGDVSDIIKVDNAYVVATLTAVNEAEYKSVKEVAAQIRNILLRDKKFEVLAAKFQGATLEEAAEAAGAKLQEFDNVKLNAYYIPGIGVEPRILGTITTAEVGKLSAPLQGASGAFVICVDEVVASAEPQTVEAEQVKAQADAERSASSRALYSVQELANVVDNSVSFF
ncbi:MAG: SurA N-terminal domain-containing protein [Alistipes sp.]|nr:SurA N-terminal domain-containing protein [Alistipes sp.]